MNSYNSAQSSNRSSNSVTKQQLLEEKQYLLRVIEVLKPKVSLTQYYRCVEGIPETHTKMAHLGLCTPSRYHQPLTATATATTATASSSFQQQRPPNKQQQQTQQEPQEPNMSNYTAFRDPTAAQQHHQQHPYFSSANVIHGTAVMKGSYTQQLAMSSSPTRRPRRASEQDGAMTDSNSSSSSPHRSGNDGSARRRSRKSSLVGGGEEHNNHSATSASAGSTTPTLNSVMQLLQRAESLQQKSRKLAQEASIVK